MKKSKLNFMPPELAEAKRIAEIQSLSYVERLERLFALMELTRLLQTSKSNTSAEA
ncbi:MAG: hypothetical protein JWP69_1410 [Flaviaesturariibacter sp.]|nr:hypothetical protein [Flaviaesturariibacter sp.]